ncbi:uncharacterized protein PMUG01_10046800 [Plasmodium malariae]|uniref:SICAvar, type II n=1 Tax=Plasmodium malariae TaxID=5858 RepID=A0A1A8WQS9_PLAMA|nr:uncharacterized protein PMUG01_10046800 [Plasmodium malariae]SBS94206.1 SICAvar, type II [Plasmodium malariae]SCN45232.1 hypothetical protein PMUG01_10046800 [Plasmodium malariae]
MNIISSIFFFLLLNLCLNEINITRGENVNQGKPNLRHGMSMSTEPLNEKDTDEAKENEELQNLDNTNNSDNSGNPEVDNVFPTLEENLENTENSKTENEFTESHNIISSTMESANVKKVNDVGSKSESVLPEDKLNSEQIDVDSVHEYNDLNQSIEEEKHKTVTNDKHEDEKVSESDTTKTSDILGIRSEKIEFNESIFPDPLKEISYQKNSEVSHSNIILGGPRNLPNTNPNVLIPVGILESEHKIYEEEDAEKEEKEDDADSEEKEELEKAVHNHEEIDDTYDVDNEDNDEDDDEDDEDDEKDNDGNEQHEQRNRDQQAETKENEKEGDQTSHETEEEIKNENTVPSDKNVHKSHSEEYKSDNAVKKLTESLVNTMNELIDDDSEVSDTIKSFTGDITNYIMKN